MLLKSAGQVLGVNRTGLVVPLPEPIAAQARSLASSQFLLDGEQVGEMLHAFDLLELDGQDLRSLTYRQRMMRLELLLDNTDAAIRPVLTARNTIQKRAMFDELQNRHAEGIVFKRADASYAPGRPNSGGTQLKLKFVETASCLVAGSNGTRRSVKLELTDENGNRVSVGSVTIPPNHAIPVAGSLVEVQYLYAYPGGSIYQPVYLGVRDDLDAAERTTGQLKLKPKT